MLLFYAPESLSNKSPKYKKLGKYFSYCTRNHARANAYAILRCIVLYISELLVIFLRSFLCTCSLRILIELKLHYGQVSQKSRVFRCSAYLKPHDTYVSSGSYYGKYGTPQKLQNYSSELKEYHMFKEKRKISCKSSSFGNLLKSNWLSNVFTKETKNVKGTFKYFKYFLFKRFL